MKSIFLVLATLWLGGCSSSSSTASRAESSSRAAQQPQQVAQPSKAPEVQPVNSPIVVLEPPGQDPVRVRVEVAATNRERMRGLMFRERMDQDAGMIFLFDRSKQNTFWMRNTLLPLDMIFIKSDMRVLGVVENATPQTDDPREVPGESQYVLEVNAGYARAHGIGPGTRVTFLGITQRAQSEDEF